MRAVVQRVKYASVRISGQIKGEIGNGLLVLLGIEDSDGTADIKWLSKKIANLRIFNDSEGSDEYFFTRCMGGEALVISQFTLHASTRKGNRPSYIRSAKPELAIPLYEEFVASLENDLGRPVSTGVFGANMKVELLNDGPVTIMIDTKTKE